MNQIAKSLLAAGLLLALGVFCCPFRTSAQGLEVSGGYSHVTGDLGLNGYNLGAAWFFSSSMAIAAQYDSGYNNARIGEFEFTSVGAIAAKSHIQDFLIGPRFYVLQHRYKRLSPFGQIQLGVSHLHSQIQEGPTPTAANSDTAFAWMLGGGADYQLAPHWSARGDLGLLRTHFANAGQSRLRLGISVTYSFGSR